VGAGRRRIDRRLSRAVAPLPPIASDDRPWLLPALSLAYAGAIALVLLAGDQLSQYMPGPWFELMGAAVLVIAGLSLYLSLRHAWFRNREQLRQRALLAVGAAAGSALLGAIAIVGLVENARVTSVISGADVRLTKPVIEAIPQPPGTRLLDETPGIAGTETIYEDFSATDLRTIVPFYERRLGPMGWVEDKTSAGTSIVRFSRGDFVLSVSIDPPSGDYTLTVDRVTTTASPTPTASPSLSPAGATASP
jgi:hypothetical protein